MSGCHVSVFGRLYSAHLGILTEGAFRREVLVADQQLLLDSPGDVRQQACRPHQFGPLSRWFEKGLVGSKAMGLYFSQII
ncbi:MAG: hypothetical protein H0X25_10995 [Acidobacteriales bacterium]|nr:hypothetical protein [Terriglobales bacterium]